MDFKLDEQLTDIDCPECQKQLSISLDEVGHTVVCPNCGININLKDAGFTDEINKASKAVDNFLDDIENMFKT